MLNNNFVELQCNLTVQYMGESWHQLGSLSNVLIKTYINNDKIVK